MSDYITDNPNILNQAAVEAIVDDRIDDIVLVQDEQPTEEDNKIWIPNENIGEVQVPTYEEFSQLKNSLDTATDSDIGKALSPKTVTGGHVTEWQFKSIGGGGTGGGAVDDVQVNGVSVVSEGVANVPVADASTFGAVKVGANGVTINSSGTLSPQIAIESDIKTGTTTSRLQIPANQHMAAFYGLAKAAGADEKDSALPAGQYTEPAKSAIRSMLGVQNFDPQSIAIVANGDTHAAILSGQYVYVRGHSTLAEGMYRAASAIAVNDTLSSSNLVAGSGGGLNDMKNSVDTLNTNLSKRIPTTDSNFCERIPENSDLDNYRTGGVFIVEYDSIAFTISHMPRAASGRLIVVPVFSGGTFYVQQYYIPSTAANVVYCRKFYSLTASVPWSPWVKMANYIVEAGTVTTSSTGTASFANTYNTNEYACLSVFTTSSVSGYILIPYKYGDAANGRWGFRACKSSDMSGYANESISYVAILMPYIAT